MGAIGPTILNHNIITCMFCLSQNVKDLDIYRKIADIPTLQIQFYRSLYFWNTEFCYYYEEKSLTTEISGAVYRIRWIDMVR